MEKLKQSQFYLYRPLPILRLYLDEIHELYEFLSEQSKGKVSIYTCGYKLTSLDEISKLPKDITNEIRFTMEASNIQINLSHAGGHIFCTDTSMNTEGIVSRIEQIFQKCKPYKPIFYEKSSWLSLLFGAPFLLGIIFFNLYLIIVGAIIWIIAFSILLIEMNYDLNRHNTIIFKRRKDATGFFNRNKDQIYLLLIGAVIGIVGTILGTLILNVLNKK